MVKKVIVGLVIVLSSNSALGESRDVEKIDSASIGLNTGTFAIKRTLSPTFGLVGSLNFQHSTYKNDNSRLDTSTADPNDRIWNTSESTRANVSITGGFRNYFSTDKYMPFIQPSVGVIAEYDRRNYYSSRDLDKSEDQTKAITFGGVALLLFGVEYFVSSQISVEGAYVLRAQYLDYDVGETSKLKSIYVSEYGELGVSYYW